MLNEYKLPASTRIARAHLQVLSLERSLAFYEGILGFKRILQENGAALLSASGEPPALLMLTENTAARPRPPRTTGLFHIAIRLPERQALALLVNQILESRWPFLGASDHKVSEALYLSDPDKNGLEIYCDRSRDRWPRSDEQVAMTTDPLDISDLLNEIPQPQGAWNGIAPGTDIGHIHLQVADLAQAEDFYHHLVGFEVTQRGYPGALFMAAGGYHHHIGANTWSSRGAPPPPPDAIGLVSYSVLIPNVDSWSILLERLQNAGRNIEFHHRQQKEKSFTVTDDSGIRVEFLYWETA